MENSSREEIIDSKVFYASKIIWRGLMEDCFVHAKLGRVILSFTTLTSAKVFIGVAFIGVAIYRGSGSGSGSGSVMISRRFDISAFCFTTESSH